MSRDSEHELKPCPFCGRSEGVEITTNREGGDAAVSCDACGTQFDLSVDVQIVAASTDELGTPQLAREHWNTRPIEARLAAELKEAREAIRNAEMLIPVGWGPQAKWRALPAVRAALADSEKGGDMSHA